MNREETTDVEESFDDHTASEVAIVGFAGRFPGAGNADEFWQNLREGVESVSFFTKEELLAAGVEPDVLASPEYVPAKAVLKDVELFDAAFFEYNPREAEMLDPQHRVMLECAVEAFEHAGYDPVRFAGRVGVYAGVSAGSYLKVNLSSHEDLVERVGAYQVDIGNHGEFVPTTISFKLNLKGPSINVQTACSTSLVAVHVACQSLLNGECDMALAGGGSITFPHREGYLYQEEGILSPDGHCRAFDAGARGTVGGEGAGLVVLKRLGDALADGDTIHAVIKGSAVNNDGSLKIGYTAPSIDGQAGVIADALAMAGVSAETISYVETHGTGTALGDPIEIAALTQAFNADTHRKNFCAVGSVKTNIGHLDAGAGVAGLIKATLALKHGQLPPSLHYERPNPKIDFAGSPFFVNHKLDEWTTGGAPRRAGVSSFGIGGTNAHVVLEEAPAPDTSIQSRPRQLLMLSAKTAAALDAATADLCEHLKQNADANLADVAHTLQVGRGNYSHRRALVCRDTADAVAALDARDAARLLTRFQEPRHHPIVFMFPGQGSQYVGMARGLYDGEPVFREQLERCAGLLAAHSGFDLRGVLYPDAEQEAEAARLLDQTYVTQPALFCVEYALAQLWMSWGVQPSALIGHSIGEYVAACLAGVLTLEDAVALVAARGQLMQSLPGGSMLALMLSEKEASALLRPGLALAAINGATNCVVSGTTEAVESLRDALNARGGHAQLLHTSHAFHSEMMDSILEAFKVEVGRVKLSAPKIPFLSNVTGTWISNAQATDANYWARHLRQTVRFADGVGELLKESERILLEVGPGRTLSTLARQHPSLSGNQVVLNSLRHPRDTQIDTEFLLTTLGKFWLAGGQIDWAGFYRDEQRRRVPLPTYPFERQRYYLEPAADRHEAHTRARPSTHKKPDIAGWFYLPSWKRLDLPRRAKGIASPDAANLWLVFADEGGLGASLVEQLKRGGLDVVSVRAGGHFGRAADGVYTVNPRQRADYQSLLGELAARGVKLAKVVHLWSMNAAGAQSPAGVGSFEQTQEGSLESAPEEAEKSFERAQECGLYSLLFLAQSLAGEPSTGELQLVVVTEGAQEVSGDETLRPETATVLAACKTIPQEHPEINCRSIDIAAAHAEGAARARLVEQLADELSIDAADRVVAYRGRHRWVQSFEPLRVDEPEKAEDVRLRVGGVYLLTGGMGAVGTVLAQYLAREWKAKLVLLGHRGLPPRGDWERWLKEHDEDADGLSRRIRNVEALEAAGAEVLTLSADVSDERQMLEALARAVERFGRIDGVIHGAAARGGEGLDKELRETTTADCARQFRPKARGLAVLEKILRGREIDFCVAFSSLSTVLGGITFTAYAAANIYMDTFVRKHNQTNPETWLSVNWDAWKVGNKGLKTNEALEALSITPEEGGEALRRILSLGSVAQVLVSTSDLQTRLDRWVTFEPSAQRDEAATTDEAASVQHPRPALAEAYVAPGNELEEELATVWRELLGIAQVGINDNFFELGGHSLLATMVISRLRKEFGVELPLRSFFESPTVSGLALAVARQVIEEQDGESVSQLLEEV